MAAKGYAYWAVIEHLQGMIGSDGEYLRQIDHKGLFPDGLAARIADDFGVIRNIQPVEAEDKTSGMRLLVKDLHELAQNWPSTLVERATACCKIAENHKTAQQECKAAKRNLASESDAIGEDHKDSSMAPYSGVTKLMWFLRPEGWTMFDSLAQFGLSGRGSSTNQVENFFQALTDQKFDEKCQEIAVICKQSKLEWLYPERVIDKFLLFRGSEFKKESVRKKEQTDGSYFEWAQQKGAYFLSCIEREAPKFHGRIDRLATAVAERLPDDSLDTEWVKKRLKKRK